MNENDALKVLVCTDHGRDHAPAEWEERGPLVTLGHTWSGGRGDIVHMNVAKLEASLRGIMKTFGRQKKSGNYATIEEN